MWKRILKRTGRVALSVGLAGIVQYATNSPYALALAPVLSALGKWARDRGLNGVPL